MTGHAYYPAEDGRGKYHRARAVTGTAWCGAAVVLDTSPLGALYAGERPHPLICRRCLASARREAR